MERGQNQGMKRKLLALALVPFLSGCGLVKVHGPPSGWQTIQDVDALETMVLTRPCTTGKGVLFLDGAAAALFGLLAGIAVEDSYPPSDTSDEVGLGMGAVSLADDLRHVRRVALKVLKPEPAAVVSAEQFHVPVVRALHGAQNVASPQRH